MLSKQCRTLFSGVVVYGFLCVGGFLVGYHVLEAAYAKSAKNTLCAQSKKQQRETQKSASENSKKKPLPKKKINRRKKCRRKSTICRYAKFGSGDKNGGKHTLKTRLPVKTVNEQKIRNGSSPVSSVPVHKMVLQKKLKNLGKMAYWSSWNRSCGIAVYLQHLRKTLDDIGYFTKVYEHTMPLNKLMEALQKDRIKIINMQFEPALWLAPGCVFSSLEQLLHFLKELKRRGIKIIVTVHNEVSEMQPIAAVADQCIYHRSSAYFEMQGKIKFIPMGIPAFKPIASREQLRQQYGFNQNHVIATTTGFMYPFKQHASILELLVPWLKAHKNHHVQLLTAFNQVAGYDACVQECANIKGVIKKYQIEDQVTHITDFIPQQELSERLWLSDVGYLWSDLSSKTSSAASKEFIAAQLPYVVTNSSHHADLIKGIIRTPIDKTIFVKAIVGALDPAVQKRLRQELQQRSEELSNRRLIMQHLAVFKAAAYNSQMLKFRLKGTDNATKTL